jgi:hypothetical protein
MHLPADMAAWLRTVEATLSLAVTAGWLLAAGLVGLRVVTFSAGHIPGSAAYIPGQVSRGIHRDPVHPTRHFIRRSVGQFPQGISIAFAVGIVIGESETGASGMSALDAGGAGGTRTRILAAESIRTGGGILVRPTTRTMSARLVWPMR